MSKLWVTKVWDLVMQTLATMYYATDCLYNYIAADVTPPILSFVSNPSYSNENVTISWSYNEESTSVCSLQSPTTTTPITCVNHSVTLTRTGPGLYSLFILSADLAGNVAPTARHTWTVGEIALLALQSTS